MIPIALLNETITVKRRTSQGRDTLNNPNYGSPTDGLGWNTVYDCVPVRLAFGSKPVQFSTEGERLTPNGIMYYNANAGVDIKAEDRVITQTGIEYNVISVVPGRQMNSVVDHWEAVLQLP